MASSITEEPTLGLSALYEHMGKGPLNSYVAIDATGKFACIDLAEEHGPLFETHETVVIEHEGEQLHIFCLKTQASRIQRLAIKALADTTSLNQEDAKSKDLIFSKLLDLEIVVLDEAETEESLKKPPSKLDVLMEKARGVFSKQSDSAQKRPATPPSLVGSGDSGFAEEVMNKTALLAQVSSTLERLEAMNSIHGEYLTLYTTTLHDLEDLRTTLQQAQETRPSLQDLTAILRNAQERVIHATGIVAGISRRFASAHAGQELEREALLGLEKDITTLTQQEVLEEFEVALLGRRQAALTTRAPSLPDAQVTAGLLAEIAPLMAELKAIEHDLKTEEALRAGQELESLQITKGILDSCEGKKPNKLVFGWDSQSNTLTVREKKFVERPELVPTRHDVTRGIYSSKEHVASIAKFVEKIGVPTTSYKLQKDATPIEVLKWQIGTAIIHLSHEK